MSNPPERILFGPFHLDLASGRLSRDGCELELRPQASRVLKVLIQNSGRDVSYEQIWREAWDGMIVSKHTVAVTVAEVKKVFEEYGSWISCRPKLGYRLDVSESDDRLKIAWHFWGRRTREGIEKALRIFQQVALENGSDRRALAGLSRSFLMLGVYGMRPPREMYRGFLNAHARAVAVSGLTPELRADRAYGFHIFERRLDEAEIELLRAQSEQPDMVVVHVRLAILYTALGRFNDALESLERGRAIDPLWPSLLAEILVHLCRRDFESAIRCGRKLLELHPYLTISRSYYAQALEYAGKVEEALRQHRLACFTSPDMPFLRAAEGACFARLGRRSKALRILEELQQLRQTQYVDAYHVALLLGALGKTSEAFDELERARRQNSASFFLLEVDPRLDSFRRDPRFARLRSKLFGSAASPRSAA